MARNDPEIAVAAQGCAKLHLDLGRPLLKRADGLFQYRDSNTATSSPSEESAFSNVPLDVSMSLSLALTSCRPPFGGAPKSTFFPLGSVTIIVLAMGRSDVDA
jgi:hypothetical protein